MGKPPRAQASIATTASGIIGRIDRDAVAGFQSLRAQGGHARFDLRMQLAISPRGDFAGLAFPEQRDLLRLRLEMTIEAVRRDVELAAHEPLGVRGIPFQDRAPALEPFELARGLFPVFFGIGETAFPNRLVLIGLDRGLPRELRGGWKRTRLFERDLDIGFGHGSERSRAGRAIQRLRPGGATG